MTESHNGGNVVLLAASLLAGCSEHRPPVDSIARDIRDTKRCEAAGMVATRGKGMWRRVDGGIVCEPKVKP